ncbi:Cytochrome c2 [Cupriavidus pampae]|uniref:Cytochrome c2 n=2 Tax=Cupriavidus pampae TaxID=659251 RepID=A0ABM8XH54_9BURK|nr:cytochrome c family protein [Cupriavidus pampae]CAG9179514.1 Cytochrome c2 [Cupriavidus pampae]
MLAAPLLPLLLPVAAYADGDAKAGERAFTSKCASCHRVGPNARGGFGPQLNGIVGRQAGTTDYRYSDAMKTAGFAWSEERLRAFVKSPGKVVPGNKMLFWGMRDEQEINDLLAYLRTFP